MAKRVVIVPTYNEAANLPLLAAEIWALRIPELAVLVVDGNSPDGTGEVADELAEERAGELFVLHQGGRTGPARAYVSGFKWALDHGAEVIIQMDCDFSHSPSYLPEMLQALEGADVVVGSRYVPGGKLDERWGLRQYFLSWFANTVYTSLILNLQVKDATSGYKVWRADCLRAVDLDGLRSNGYSFQFELAYLAEKLGFRVVEVPIHYEDRRVGHSKLGLLTKLQAAIDAWQILWRYRDLNPAPHEADAQIHR